MKNEVIQMGYRWSEEYIISLFEEGEESLYDVLVYRLEKALKNNISWNPKSARIIIEKENYIIPDNINEILNNTINKLCEESICNY